MKKILSIVIALVLVSASVIVTVSAFNDGLTADFALHLKETSTKEVQPQAIVCGHSSSNWKVVGTSATSHSLRCSICGATDDYEHTERTKCESDSCSVCHYSFPFVNHITELRYKCLDDYAETHAYVCTNIWYTGACEYYTGEESCSPYATGEYLYDSASNGLHRRYQECSECGIWVYRGTVTCHKSIGETTCEYCDEQR